MTLDPAARPRTAHDGARIEKSKQSGDQQIARSNPTRIGLATPAAPKRRKPLSMLRTTIRRKRSREASNVASSDSLLQPACDFPLLPSKREDARPQHVIFHKWQDNVGEPFLAYALDLGSN